jgi:carboxypeptidase PM20D1
MAVEKKKLFKAKMSNTICETFKRLSTCMSGGLKFVFKNVKVLKPLLIKVMPMLSNTANAMLKTTVAFTMAKGVLQPPTEEKRASHFPKIFAPASEWIETVSLRS